MFKKTLTLVLSLILLVAGLSLTSCMVQPEDAKKYEALQEENEALRKELYSLRKELKAAKAATSEAAENDKTKTEPTKPSVTKRKVEVIPGVTEEEDFVYDGPLEVDGKKLKELSREELEAMPTIVNEITNPKTGEVSKIYPPEGVTNLYEQLRYNAYINEQIDHNTPGVDDKTDVSAAHLPAGAYDTQQKSLVAMRDWKTDRWTLFELTDSDNQELEAWLDQVLVEKNKLEEKAKAELDFAADSHIFASDGREIYFLEQDFTKPSTKDVPVVRDHAGDYYALPDKKSLGLALRDLITANRDLLIFDSQELPYQEQRDKALPLEFSLQVVDDGKSGELTILNRSKTTWYYTGIYAVYYYSGEDWSMLPAKNVGDNFNIKPKAVLPEEERTFTLKWGDTYGDLPSGFYRLGFSLQAEDEQGEESAEQEYISNFFVIYAEDQ